MLGISKKLLFLFFSIIVLGHYSLAMEHEDRPLTRTEQNNNAIPLRQLDLTGYDNLDSTKLILTKDGAYGFQNPHCGVFEQKIFNAIQSFSLTQEDRWVYVEVGAGYGLFPLRVYEHTHNPGQACFIVNDLISDQLSGLLKLMFTPNEKNKGLLSSFKIFPGDCLEMMFETRGFKNSAPNGADFISCLNCGHFFSPNKLLMLFARVSETLKGGGKLHFMHDSGKIDANAVEFIESLSITKEYYNSLNQSERKLIDQQIESLLTSSATKLASHYARISFIINRLKERNFHYPTFISKSIMENFTKVGTDQFYPSVDFIKEIAKAVGLNLIETGARIVTEGGIPQEVEVNSEEASSLWYIFEKDHTSSLGASDEESFKQLLCETELADKERKTIDFKPVSWFPFVEEVWSPFKEIAASLLNEEAVAEKVPVKKKEAMDAATQKKAEDLYKRAYTWFDKGQQTKGIQCLRKAAMLGYANAQCDLGLMYSKGTGIPKDEEEGLKWFKEAADQDFVTGQFNYGFTMLKKGNEEIAYVYLKKAAGQGNTNAKLIIEGGSFMIA